MTESFYSYTHETKPPRNPFKRYETTSDKIIKGFESISEALENLNDSFELSSPETKEQKAKLRREKADLEQKAEDLKQQVEYCEYARFLQNTIQTLVTLTSYRLQELENLFNIKWISELSPWQVIKTIHAMPYGILFFADGLHATEYQSHQKIRTSPIASYKVLIQRLQDIFIALINEANLNGRNDDDFLAKIPTIEQHICNVMKKRESPLLDDDLKREIFIEELWESRGEPFHIMWNIAASIIDETPIKHGELLSEAIQPRDIVTTLKQHAKKYKKLCLSRQDLIISTLVNMPESSISNIKGFQLSDEQVYRSIKDVKIKPASLRTEYWRHGLSNINTVSKDVYAINMSPEQYRKLLDELSTALLDTWKKEGDRTADFIQQKRDIIHASRVRIQEELSLV